MFFREINQNLKLSLSIPQYGEEMFQLINKNRDFLKQWLPWLDNVKVASDSREFIELQLLIFKHINTSFKARSLSFTTWESLPNHDNISR